MAGWSIRKSIYTQMFLMNSFSLTMPLMVDKDYKKYVRWVSICLETLSWGPIERIRVLSYLYFKQNEKLTP